MPFKVVSNPVDLTKAVNRVACPSDNECALLYPYYASISEVLALL